MAEASLMDTYELHETLGSGGGGTVIRAYHKRLKKDVVIKKIHSDIQTDEERRIEADILKNLHHQYLPQVYDYFVENGSAYTVMDFVQGESFGQKLARGERFPERKVIKYAKQICEALNYLHSQKLPVIHGDIKPDNIMLTPEDNVCLIDFNISGITRNGHAVTFGYTEGYGAPEQYREFQRISALMQSAAGEVSAGGPGRTEKLGASGGGPGRTEKLGASAGGPGRTEKLETSAGGPGRTEKLGASAGGPGRTEKLGASAGGVGRTEKLGIFAGGPGWTEKLGASAGGSGRTEKLDFGNGGNGEPAESFVQAPATQPELTEGIPIDKRSDIYSLGATLYHIYSGQMLSRDARNSISGRTSEGFLFILNKALQEEPDNRYQDAGQMLAAVSHLHKHDSRYRNMRVRHAVTYIVLTGLLLGGTYLVLRGRDVYEKERQAKYDSYIENMTAAREAGSGGEFEALFEETSAFMPDRLEAYYQKAVYLYETGQYQDAVNFVRRTLDENSGFYTQNSVSDMYYVMGTSYLELMNYDSAANAFENAIKYNDQAPEYYVDEAIALARNGNTARAREVLKQAEEKGALSDTVFLVNGEIWLAEEDYTNAEEAFQKSIAAAENDYTRMRAYVMCSKAILGQGSTVENADKGINLLEGALNVLPQEYQAMILEQLTGLYVTGYEATEEIRYAEGALNTLERIEAAGWATFVTYDNRVNLYYRIGDYEAEAQLLAEMEQKYPDHYKVPMKQAFLEATLQGGKPLEERDYNLFVTYYERAQEIYSAMKKDGWSDAEMQVLENAYQELVDGHWIDGR